VTVSVSRGVANHIFQRLPRTHLQAARLVERGSLLSRPLGECSLSPFALAWLRLLPGERRAQMVLVSRPPKPRMRSSDKLVSESEGGLERSQPLQTVACGHTPLQSEYMRPLFPANAASAMRHFSCGWLPPRDRDDPVMWVSRDSNVLVEYFSFIRWTDRCPEGRSAEPQLESIISSYVLIVVPGRIAPLVRGPSVHLRWRAQRAPSIP